MSRHTAYTFEDIQNMGLASLYGQFIKLTNQYGHTNAQIKELLDITDQTYNMLWAVYVNEAEGRWELNA